jgi:hypothetical protein
MQKPRAPLRRARRAVAADHGLALLVDERRAALGAGLGNRERGFRPGALVDQGTDDLGDHLAALLDHDSVPHADVLAADLLEVVQRRAGDRRAEQEHGLEVGDRRDRPSAPDLQANGFERRHRRLGLELERQRPARTLGRGAEQALLAEVVDLHHQAVGVVAERAARLLPARDLRLHAFDAVDAPGVRVDAQAERFEPGEHVDLATHAERDRIGDRVGEIREPPPRHLARVEHLERTGRRVARVRVRRLALGLAAGVELVEARALHVDLAAHLDGRGLVECERESLERAQVLGDVVADLAVAARDPQGEPARLVAQDDRDAVDLELDHVVDGLNVERLADAGIEVAPLVERVAVVDREHRRRVAHGANPPSGLSETRRVGESGVIHSGCAASASTSAL